MTPKGGLEKKGVLRTRVREGRLGEEGGAEDQS